eukprot:2024158-Alexandrium_andersonii.AAC.1
MPPWSEWRGTVLGTALAQRLHSSGLRVVLSRLMSGRRMPTSGSRPDSAHLRRGVWPGWTGEMRPRA